MALTAAQARQQAYLDAANITRRLPVSNLVGRYRHPTPPAPSTSTAVQVRESLGDEYILQYLPPAISAGGIWELLPRAVYNDQGPAVEGYKTNRVIEAAAGASEQELSALVAVKLGYPVRLSPGWQTLRPRRLSRLRTYPVYLVTPSGRNR